ncbi:hypothetical protein Mgra_00001705 [Meloidogyne graminicola]|uniref:Uncharacterized protein n=1 Tax=Meloidogyne graminicola TaxID=189291 RepID=A0A8T0A0T2_9BILA|nr:hypothetical protein Mgra_00001705 [Meloidogyne graminicola]
MAFHFNLFNIKNKDVISTRTLFCFLAEGHLDNKTEENDVMFGNCVKFNKFSNLFHNYSNSLRNLNKNEKKIKKTITKINRRDLMQIEMI